MNDFVSFLHVCFCELFLPFFLLRIDCVFFLTFFLFELFCLTTYALFLGVAGWMCIVFNVLQGFEASSFQAAATAAKEASHSRAQATMVSS